MYVRTITGHARLAWYTGWNEHDLGVFEAVAQA